MYHQPAIAVLTKTKCEGEEADRIMATFNYPHSIKVDAEGAAGGIYNIWNDQVTIQSVTLTQQEVYLFVNVKNLSFFLANVYARPYLHFKKIIR